MADTHQIQKFLDAFQGGTRPNRYKITGDCPAIGGLSGQVLFETHCSAATLPEAKMGAIQLPFRGRQYNFPGDREYAPWSCTIIDDLGDNNSWDKLHKWNNLFNDHASNTPATSIGRTYTKAYTGTITIVMLDHVVAGDKAHKKIQLKNAYPVSISGIDLGTGKANEVTQFAVTFNYTHYEVTDSKNAKIVAT
jgi:hypothetical protein